MSCLFDCALSCNFVNSAGLALDITGAVLIWNFALPELIDQAGGELLTIGSSDPEAVKAKYKRYSWLGKLGLWLLLAGFLLQLVSNWID